MFFLPSKTKSFLGKEDRGCRKTGNYSALVTVHVNLIWCLTNPHWFVHKEETEYFTDLQEETKLWWVVSSCHTAI